MQRCPAVDHKINLIIKILQLRAKFKAPVVSQLTFTCYKSTIKTCHNGPPSPPLPRKQNYKGLPSSLLKACGFSVVMVGKTFIVNQCFVEYIIFFLRIMTYRNSFPNSVRRLTAL